MNEKKSLTPKWKWQRKLGKPIDKKPLNLAKSVERNRKIVDALNFLAPQGTLKKSSIIGKKSPIFSKKQRRKTQIIICY